MVGDVGDFFLNNLRISTEGEDMAKKKVRKQTKKQNKKTKSKPSAKKIILTIDEKTNLPSVGGYYIRPKKKGFSLYLKSFKDGKPLTPHLKIDEAVYYRFGLNPDLNSAVQKNIEN